MNHWLNAYPNNFLFDDFAVEVRFVCPNTIEIALVIKKKVPKK